MGKIYDRMFMIGQAIDESHTAWKEHARKSFDDRWEYLHSFMHGAGYAVDPEFMHVQSERDEAVQNGIMEVIERLCLRKVMLEAPDPQVAMTTLTVQSDEVVNVVAQCEEELSAYTEGLGNFTRGSAKVNAQKMEPAVWWAQYGRHLPMLSFIAATVLAQVVSASAAERNWSIYGQVKYEGRSRLGHSKSDKLVYNKTTLALRAKLQTASYKVKLHDWDENDSNSGSSDSEDLECLKF